MLRITQNLITNSIINGIHSNQSSLYSIQAQTASGKKFTTPSEDPAGMTRSLRLKRELDNLSHYSDNIDRSYSLLGMADTSLGEIGDILIQARSIAQEQSTATADPTYFNTAADQIDSLIDQAVGIMNSSFEGSYIFSGTAADRVPFVRQADGSVRYMGNSDSMFIDAADSISVDISLPGNEVTSGAPASLGGPPSDLNPDIDEDTLLNSLNGGAGVSRGTIKITDREGNEALIDLSSAETIDDVLEKLNERTDVNIEASVNDEGNGITIIDTSGSPVEGQELMVEEVDGGTTALDLGILSSSIDGEIVGIDTDPVLTGDTSVNLLRGGEGLLLGRVRISNGDFSAEIDFHGSETVDDILRKINDSGVMVNASLDSSGKSIVITSLDVDNKLVISDLDGYNTSYNLGIIGSAESKDFFSVLETLREGLLEGDTDKIASTIEELTSSITSTANVRADVGNRMNDMDLARNRNQDTELTLTELLSENEDIDFAEAMINLTSAQMVYESSLATSTQLLSVSLVNFIG